MKLFGLIVLLMFGLEFSSPGQQCFEVNANTSFLDLKRNTFISIDSSGDKLLADAPKLKYTLLQNISLPPLLFEEYRYSFFIHTCLTNTSNDTLKFLISSGEFYSQEMLLMDGDGHVTVQKTSQLLLESQRPYSFDHKYLRIELNPTSTTSVYLKINDLTGKAFKINPLIIKKEFESSNRVSQLYKERPVIFISTALYALLLNMVLVALALYYFSKKRYLIFFSLYVFFLLGFNVYGFSYSSFSITLFDYIPFLKFQLRQSFYILGAQIFLILFIQDFTQVKTDGTLFQKRLFKFYLLVFISLMFLELFISLILKRYDWELRHSILIQLVVSLLGLVLIVYLFLWKNLNISLLFKLASASLFVGVIYGFIAAAFGLQKSSSELFLYYPDFIFEFFIFSDILLYSAAIIEQFFKNFGEQGRLQKQYALTELSLLRSQINPHFLFNTLNSIKSAIFKQTPKETSQYLTDFSDLIRSVLEKSRDHIVSLKEEIAITENYLKLEQRRFKQPFSYYIDRELNIDLEKIMVPAFIIQPFVENAIKHGFSGQKPDGLIKISLFKSNEILHIAIEDNGIGRTAASEQKKWFKPHQSMGQQLIADRLNLLNDIYDWGLSYTVEDLHYPTGTKVLLRIPFMH